MTMVSNLYRLANQGRRILALMLLVSLPFQGLAATTMECHGHARGAPQGPSQTEGHHPHQHQHQHQQQHQHHDQAAAEQTQEDHHQTKPSLASLPGVSTCAVCAGCCVMSAVIPITTQVLIAKVQRVSPETLALSHYTGFTPEGLLRPPR
ncbi:MAG: hypothetical protein ACO24F_07220 [Burkholderiaceae bacterium]